MVGTDLVIPEWYFERITQRAPVRRGGTGRGVVSFSVVSGLVSVSGRGVSCDDSPVFTSGVWSTEFCCLYKRVGTSGL